MAAFRTLEGFPVPLAGAVLKGNPAADVFTAPVSLTSEATVLDHLVELLGNDAGVAFSIQRTLTGKYVLWLSSSSRTWAVADATCRGLSFTYDNLHDAGCVGLDCGSTIVYDVTAINTCTDDNCEGQRVTEMVTTDQGCLPGDVTTGAGCPIGPGNSIPNCTDTSSLCASPDAFPASCTEIYTQQTFAGGNQVETCQITFTITKSDLSCDGSIDRSCTPVHQDTQCCQGDFCPPDFPNCCPDLSSAACCSSAFPNCCAPGSAGDCCQDGFPVCCSPGTGPCCTFDFPNCCVGFCCPSSFPICGDPGSFQCFSDGARLGPVMPGAPAAPSASGGGDARG